MEEEMGQGEGKEGSGKARLYLRAQIAESIAEVNQIVKEIKPAVRAPSGGNSHCNDDGASASRRKSTGGTATVASRKPTTSPATSSKKTGAATPASLIPVEIPLDNEQDYVRAYSMLQRSTKDQTSPPLWGDNKSLSADVWGMEGWWGKGGVGARQQ